MNPLTLVLRVAVLLVGVYLILGLAVSEFRAPSGAFLDSAQHVVAGLAYLAGGIVLLILAVAPAQVGNVFQFIVRLGRG